jgi:glutaminase
MSSPESTGYHLELEDIDDERQVVSTGSLPRSVEVRTAVTDAYDRYRDVRDGENASHYPALAQVDPDLFGIAVVSTNGDIHTAGAVDSTFAIMSIAKPFVLALVVEMLGADTVRRQVGVNATGFAFNSGIPVEQNSGHLTNPMVNSGALATTSLVPGATVDDRWESIVANLSRFAGRRLELDDTIYTSASQSNHRNRALANLLHSYGRLYGDIDETLDLYTRQSSLSVTTLDLAVMGCTLAGGGVNPITGDQVVGRACCRRVLTVMATAGLYETSGDWLFDVGLPGKSGVSGGIVTVSPGKGSLATFSPPLDHAGNSVRGQLVASFLSYRLGFDLFSSNPDPARGA